MVLLVGNRIYHRNCRYPLLYQFDGHGRSLPQIIVPGYLPAHFHRLCHRRLHAMDAHTLGITDHRHDNGSMRRQHDRRTKMYSNGHSRQSVTQ